MQSLCQLVQERDVDLRHALVGYGPFHSCLLTLPLELSRVADFEKITGHFGCCGVCRHFVTLKGDELIPVPTEVVTDILPVDAFTGTVAVI